MFRNSTPLTRVSTEQRPQFSMLPVPRSPGTHIVGPWVIDSINSYRDLRTRTQYIGNWASRVCLESGP